MEDEAVIDASVAFKLIVREEYSREAAILMLALARARVRIIAPPLFPFEITNGLHRRVRAGSLTPATANGLLRILDTFGIELDASNDLRRRALARRLRSRRRLQPHRLTPTPTPTPPRQYRKSAA